MHRFIEIWVVGLTAILFASPAVAETVNVEGEGFFTFLDPDTGLEEDIGAWNFLIETAEDRNHGSVYWVTGTYDDGDTEDEYGTFEGVFVHDEMNGKWVLDLHLTCTPCSPAYESDVRLVSTDDATHYQGYWWDSLTQTLGYYGHGEIYFPGLVDVFPQLAQQPAPWMSWSPKANPR